MKGIYKMLIILRSDLQYSINSIIFHYMNQIITFVGFILITYRTIHQISHSQKHQFMAKKWLIYTSFLKIQTFLASLFAIIPLGSFILMALKILIILPENSVTGYYQASTYLFHKIESQMQKLQFDQYHSKSIQYFSTFLKILSINSLQIIKSFVIYVQAHQLKQVQQVLTDLCNQIEYKKTTVNVRKSIISSKRNQDVNQSTALQNYQQDQSQDIQFQQNVLSKNIMLLQCEPLLLIQSNPQPKYKQITLFLDPRNLDIQIKGQKIDINCELKQIRTVNRSAMILELIMKNAGSKIIKLQHKKDVIEWLKPAIMALKKNKS